MSLSGDWSGHLILLCDDADGLALADLLLGNSPGTSKSWEEYEQSALKETANIVGCAFVNAIVGGLASAKPREHARAAFSVVPGPPGFRHEFAASLLEFVLMDQAVVGDRVLLVATTFTMEDSKLNWSLVLAPSGETLSTIAQTFSDTTT